MSRFVQPETVTLPISRGDTLVVKKRLTEGERRAAFARINGKGDGSMAMVVAYLVDWSLTDDAGRRVTIAGLPDQDRQAILDSLDPEDFTEIGNAIAAHIEAVAVERDAQKKTGGATASAATSTSVS